MLLVAKLCDFELYTHVINSFDIAGKIRRRSQASAHGTHFAGGQMSIPHS